MMMQQGDRHGYVLQQRTEGMVQDQIELQRLDHVELAFQNVLVLERVHGLVFIHASYSHQHRSRSDACVETVETAHSLVV
jgi:hypothetical protein